MGQSDMETRERCSVCDRVKAESWQTTWYHPPLCECQHCMTLCHSGPNCLRFAIDWRTRALAAEARIREAVEALIKPDGACWDAFDFSSARTRGLFVLTRDPVPEPTRKPEVTP